MTMRKTILAVTALCAAVAAAPSPATAATKLLRCAEKGSTTLQANKDGRIYSRKADKMVYACLYARNRRVKLGHASDCGVVPEATGYQLAGRYVGWVRTECGGPAGFGDVVLTDLRTGKIVRSAPAVTASDPNNEGSNGVDDFVVNASGSIAWIGSYGLAGGPEPNPDDRVQVRKLEAGSPAGGTLVDSGPAIVLDSLALTRGGFYYRKGPTPLFSPLQ